MGKLIDMTGNRYGRLLVLKRYGTSRSNHVLWLCRCDCGKESVVSGQHLRSGHTKSCGCNVKDISTVASVTHGMSGTRLYAIWCNMRERCYRRNRDDYPEYGGRGIEVCPEWRDNFEAFRDWALVNGYQEYLTLDRTDTNGDYCPENCRWATLQQQANNTRTNRLITYNGETHTLSQWADLKGISYDTLRNRLNRGWTVERALSTSPPPLSGGFIFPYSSSMS